MVDCMECTNFIECHYSGQLTGRLTSCPDFKQKPMTNAQKIRAMTDEELAFGIKKIFIGKSPWCDHHCRLDDSNSCNACLKNWLKQPAEGDA